MRAQLQKENEWSWGDNCVVVEPIVACAGAVIPVAVAVSSHGMAVATAVTATASGWLSQVGARLAAASKNSL